MQPDLHAQMNAEFGHRGEHAPMELVHESAPIRPAPDSEVAQPTFCMVDTRQFAYPNPSRPMATRMRAAS
jgi:hypothetical protein